MLGRRYKLSVIYNDGYADEHEFVIPFSPGTYELGVNVADSIHPTGSEYAAEHIVVDKQQRTYEIGIAVYDQEWGSTDWHYATFTTPSLALEDLTWAEIAAISEAGKAQEVFSLGDKKSLGNGFGNAVIIGFDHDDLADGSGKAGITFYIDTPLYDSDLNAIGINVDKPTQMNATDTNAGGWGTSKMLNQTMAALCTVKPFNEFLTNIKIVNKQYYNFPDPTNTSNKESLVAASRFFLLSYQEVYTPVGTIYAGEGSKYSYVMPNRDPLINTAPVGRLRSRVGSATDKFLVMRDDLIFDYALASATSYPIQFGFCI